MWFKVRKLSLVALLGALLCGASAAYAQDKAPVVSINKSDKLVIGGFVRTDVIYDTRQNQQGAEGLFSFYPLAYKEDAAGKDINATPLANALALTTRFTTTYTGLELWGATTKAYVEADFGSSISGNFRLRQAYMELNWENSSLLMGQTWNPLSAAIIPTTLGLNTGAPFRPFNRSPQIRLNQTVGDFTMTLAAVYQHSYLTNGPDGTSTKYLRNGVLPDMVLGIKWTTSQAVQMGLTGETKRIKPRLSTTSADGTKVYKTDEMLQSYTGQAWFRYKKDLFTLQAAALYTQNMHDNQMLGGYAVSSYNPLTGHETYTATQHANYWMTLEYGSQLKFGLFAGYIENLGTTDEISSTATFYGRACDMEYMYRIAPRVYYTISNFQLAGEVEYTTASFGTIRPNSKGVIDNGKEVSNVKFNVAAFFFF